MSPSLARSIIHVDLDAFFASVEELLDPSIAGLPVLVGGDPSGRGVVASASYAARAYGIHSAMPMAQALRLCPQAVARHGHYGVYDDYSKRVMSILSEYTPLVEPISIDEAFLDVTGCEKLFGAPDAVARRIQERISRELGLPASLGIASNKLVAKIASTLSKPRGILVIPDGEEEAFLAPLPIERLWGVGKVTARRIHAHGVNTIGQLATLPDDPMRALFGSGWLEMRHRSQGIDDSEVHTEWRRKSVSQERTFAQDEGDLATLRRTLLGMCEAVASDLRKKGQYSRTVVLKLRFPDFSTITRRTTLSQPTDLAEIIHSEAVRLLERAWKPGVRFRLIGVGATGLADSRQLELFDGNTQRLTELSRTVDEIRDKFGRDAIRRASLLGRPKE